MCARARARHNATFLQRGVYGRDLGFYCEVMRNQQQIRDTSFTAKSWGAEGVSALTRIGRPCESVSTLARKRRRRRGGSGGRGSYKEGSTSGKVSLPNKHSGSTLVVTTVSVQPADGLMEGGGATRQRGAPSERKPAAASRRTASEGINGDSHPVDSYFRR